MIARREYAADATSLGSLPSLNARALIVALAEIGGGSGREIGGDRECVLDQTQRPEVGPLELHIQTGVPDAVFQHNGRSLGVGLEQAVVGLKVERGAMAPERGPGLHVVDEP